MDKVLEKSRYLILLAVGAALAASAAAFLWGTWKTVLIVVELVRTGGKDPLVAVSLIELMDKFLIAVGLYIFAVGMYELFFKELQLPDWLVVHSLQDIKGLLSNIVILVMAITFLERLVESQDARGILFSGIGIALVSAALIAFNAFGAKH